MKVILIGSTGQLGRDIISNSPKNIQLIKPKKSELDLSDPENCYKYIISQKANWIINSGAFTNVDEAENNKELAFKINAYGPQSIANAILKVGGKLLQISTDYVFSGTQNTPYETNQKVSPNNIYGKSKAIGENLLLQTLSSFNQITILRTSWLMSPHGKNFATKMLELHSKKENINVVYDQIGSPTMTSTLSQTIWGIIKKNEEYTLQKKSFPKINHFADNGIASWYDVAIAIGEIGIKLGLIKKAAHVTPIRSYQYPTPSARPSYSVLETNETKELLQINGIYWKDSLEEALKR